jgi:ABC-type nitrate/sulfonate/bicarbonate transport system substrate-binding protein
METQVKKIMLGVPDLVSNSYFAAIAAVELGFFKREGIDAGIELIYPGDRTFAALRDGAIDFVAAPAHSTLAVFPAWRGAKLAAALSQGTYWLLIMDKALKIAAGDLNALKGKRIGAAPFVELTFRQLLIDAGFELDRDDIQIVAVPGADEPGVSFGIAAAKALKARLLDGFWANGLGAEASIRGGVGDVVLDVRRGLGPATAFDYTFPALVTSQAAVDRDPSLIEAGVRAVVNVQAALRRDVGLARKVGAGLFPAEEAAMIEDVVGRDLPYYAPHISQKTFDGLVRFSQARKLLHEPVAYEDVVGIGWSRIWDAAGA